MGSNATTHHSAHTVDLTLSSDDENDSLHSRTDSPARHALQRFNPRKDSANSPQTALNQFQPRKRPPLPNTNSTVAPAPAQQPARPPPAGRAVRSVAQDPRRRFDAIAARTSRPQTPQRQDAGAVATPAPVAESNMETSRPGTAAAVRDVPRHPPPLAGAQEPRQDLSNYTGIVLKSKSGPASIAAAPVAHSHTPNSNSSTGQSRAAAIDAQPAQHQTFTPSRQDRPISPANVSTGPLASPAGVKRLHDGSHKLAPRTDSVSRPGENGASSMPFAENIPDEPLAGRKQVPAYPPASLQASLGVANAISNPQASFRVANPTSDQRASTVATIGDPYDPEEAEVVDLAQRFGNQTTVQLAREMFASLRKYPHVGKIRMAAWTLAEDRLILHLRKDLAGVFSWRATGDFFPHRNSWHPMQSRYSSKLQKLTLESLSQHDGTLEESLGYLPVLRHRQPPQPSQPASMQQQLDASKLLRPQRAARIAQNGVYRERRMSSLSPSPSEPSPEQPSPYVTAGPQTRNRTARYSPEASNRSSNFRDAPVSRRSLQCNVSPFIERLLKEQKRDLAAAASLMQTIPGARTRQTVQRPYLSNSVRNYLTEGLISWDQTTAESWLTVADKWLGAVIHVDMNDDELGIIELATCAIRKLKVTDPSLSLQERLHTLLLGAPDEHIRRIARKIVWDGSCAGRSEGAIEQLVYDICDDKADTEHEAAPTSMVSLGLSQSTYSRGQMLRRGELGLSQSRGSLREFDTLGPALYFKGTSADVNMVAWGPDADAFAVASFAVSDESSVAYNKPNNLLYGRISGKSLVELPQHATFGEGTSAMQDPLLFQTVSGLAFSADGLHMVTAGYDRQARVWDTSGKRPRLIGNVAHEQRVDVISVGYSGVFATGTQGYSLSNGEQSGSIIRVLRLDDTDASSALPEHHTQKYLLKNPSMPLEPACLRFGHASEGRYLLGAFTSSELDYGRGAMAIWDVASSTTAPLAHISSGGIFDAVWSPHVFGRIAVGSSRPANVNPGTHSVIRIFESSRWSSRLELDKHHSMELECPAKDMNDVLFCPTDPFLINTGCTDGKVYVWDIRNPDSVLHVFAHEKTLSEKGDDELVDTGVRFLSWGQSGRNMYSGSSDGIVVQWDPYRSPEDAYIRDVVRLESGVMSGAFSPDFTNLLLGDVAGSISVLSVGHDDLGLDMRQAEPFKFEEATTLREEMREIPDETPDTGLNLASELLHSGKVVLRPFGNLPKLQAVQGPEYVEPCAADRHPGHQPSDPVLRQQYYDNVVPGMRDAATAFQARARLNEGVEPCACTAETHWVTEEDFGNSEAWKQRIPAEVRKAHELLLDDESTAAVDAARLPIRCFRCDRYQLTVVDSPEMLRLGDFQQDTYWCPGCGAGWMVDVLGYTPVLLSTPNKGHFRHADDAFGGASIVELDDEDNPAEDYYHTLWGS